MNDPIGYRMYMSNGYMAVQFMAPHRHSFASGDPLKGTQEEYVDAATTFSAYCGTYSIKDNTVTHHVQVSFFPNYIGQHLVRTYAFHDDTLILTTPPMMLEGEEQTAQLVWRKVE